MPNCWPVCTASFSNAVCLIHVTVSEILTHTVLIYTTSSAPEIHQMVNYSEYHMSMQHSGKIKWGGGAVEEKGVTCNARYPPFSRTTHEQKAREAVSYGENKHMSRCEGMVETDKKIK